MLIKTKNGFETVRLKKGKHLVKCVSCGITALRGNSTKQCHLGGAWYGYGRYECDKPVVHMPETCVILGGACSHLQTSPNPTKAG